VESLIHRIEPAERPFNWVDRPILVARARKWLAQFGGVWVPERLHQDDSGEDRSAAGFPAGRGHGSLGCTTALADLLLIFT
jgi:hypothetical protein